MGYVEVGGNGSVIWVARHDRGTHGVAHPGGGWGRDNAPITGSGATFTILVDGQPVGGNPPVDTSKIAILWGDHSPSNPPPDNSGGGRPMNQANVENTFRGFPHPPAVP